MMVFQSPLASNFKGLTVIADVRFRNAVHTVGGAMWRKEFWRIFGTRRVEGIGRPGPEPDLERHIGKVLLVLLALIVVVSVPGLS